MQNKFKHAVVCVTLSPAIDRIAEVNKIKLGELNRINQHQDIPAGKGINVAKVLKNLGIEAVVSGFLSNNSNLHLEFLKANNITNNCIMHNFDTRLNLKIKDSSYKITELNFNNNNISELQLNDLINLLSNMENEIFILAGNLPNGLPSNSYKLIIERLKQKGKIVILDTNGSALNHGVEGIPNIIKPNLNEFQELAETTTFLSEKDIVDIAGIYINKGIETVIVSMAERGAVFINDDYAYKITVEKIKAINSVGAGDAMVAGFCTGLYNDKSFLDASKLATAASIASLSVDGVGVNKSELERIYNNLTVTQL